MLRPLVLLVEWHWGLVGSFWGLGKWLGRQRLFHGCSPLAADAGGVGGHCATRVAPTGATISLKPSSPCLVSRRRKRCVLELFFPLPASVVFAAPSFRHSWKLIRVKIAVGHVWKPPEAGPGALQAEAHGKETVSLRGLVAARRIAFSCISLPLGVQSFSTLVSWPLVTGGESWSGAGWAAEHPAHVLAQRAGGSCSFLAPF